MTQKNSIGYTLPVSSKKGLAGFGHPNQLCDESRSLRTGIAASLFVPQVLAARWEAREGLPVLARAARLTNPSSRRHRLVTRATVFVNRSSWRPIMAVSFCTGTSAQITPFSFNTHAVRVILRDGEPWFVATDVCAALAVQNVTQAVARLDDDERSMFNIGRQGDASIINESGLYSLILSSRKPEAKRFKKWVTSEVLPSIRKTGGYQQPGHMARAMTAASAVAAQVQAAVFEQVLAGKAGWKYGRWMLSFSEGRDNAVTPCVMPIENDAAVMSLAQLAKAIAEPGGMMPSNADLANLAAACNKRLAERIEYQASKKVAEISRS